jgi:hypothetical protein
MDEASTHTSGSRPHASFLYGALRDPDLPADFSGRAEAGDQPANGQHQRAALLPRVRLQKTP